MKILVVDDDPSAREFSKRFLTLWGYEVLEAGDGEEAFDLLRREEIRLVLSDWLMPHLSGPDLCRKIRAAGFPYYTYIILCTAKNAKQDLIEGMEAGADDFLVKPFGKPELRVRVRAGQRVVNLETGLEARNQELSEANVKLYSAYERIEEDLKAAGWMQARLLPSVAPVTLGVRSEWRFRPCRFVAGDTLNIFELDPQHVGFYLLDVSGHGVPAAMLSVTLSMLMNPELGEGNPLKRFDPLARTYVPVGPADAVAELNRRFQSREDQYFTMIYGLLHTTTLMFRFSQAGHPSPLLIRKGSGIRALGTGGPPVGILPQAEYETVEMQLEPGDRLFVYSDGVLECSNPAGEMFGEQRMLDYLHRTTASALGEMVSGLETELETWRGKPEFDDDISMLALEISKESK